MKILFDSLDKIKALFKVYEYLFEFLEILFELIEKLLILEKPKY